jgi:hypothetical protein
MKRLWCRHLNCGRILGALADGTLLLSSRRHGHSAAYSCFHRLLPPPRKRVSIPLESGMNKQISHGHGVQGDPATALFCDVALAFETAMGSTFAGDDSSAIQDSCGAWTAAGKAGPVEKASAVQSRRSETQSGCPGPGAEWGIPPAGIQPGGEA